MGIKDKLKLFYRKMKKDETDSTKILPPTNLNPQPPKKNFQTRMEKLKILFSHENSNYSTIKSIDYIPESK